MKYLILTFSLLLKSVQSDFKQVIFAPIQSTSFLTKRVEIISQFYNNELNTDFICTSAPKFSNFKCVRTINLNTMLDSLLEYRYLKYPPSGDNKTRDFDFSWGSVKYNFLDSYHPKVITRLNKLSHGNIIEDKGGFRTMEEPAFSNFPDVELGITIVGDLDSSKSSSNGTLFILGGAKYDINSKSIKMIKSFSIYDFNVNKWKDSSDGLPTELELIAGHNVVNIKNEYLVVLGGYKTNEYTISQGKLSSSKAEFFNFKNIWTYDILEAKWSLKSTNLDQKIENLLNQRLQYACTTEYYNNMLYVYPGFYVDSSSKNIVHLLGLLNLEDFTWNWKQLEVSNSNYKDPPNNYYSSDLKGDKMIITVTEMGPSTVPNFIGFDLINKNFTDTYQLVEEKPKDSNPSTPVSTGIRTYIWIILAIAVLVILFVLFKLYIYNRETKGYLPKYENYHIWSDLDKSQNQSNLLELKLTATPNFDSSLGLDRLEYRNQLINIKNIPTSRDNTLIQKRNNEGSNGRTVVNSRREDNGMDEWNTATGRKWNAYSSY
jgi:hypothetical protein